MCVFHQSMKSLAYPVGMCAVVRDGQKLTGLSTYIWTLFILLKQFTYWTESLQYLTRKAIQLAPGSPSLSPECWDHRYTHLACMRYTWTPVCMLTWQVPYLQNHLPSLRHTVSRILFPLFTFYLETVWTSYREPGRWSHLGASQNHHSYQPVLRWWALCTPLVLSKPLVPGNIFCR